MTYLKLQLKALEVQASETNVSQDPGLLDGIRRWKLDWADTEARFNVRDQEGESNIS